MDNSESESKEKEDIFIQNLSFTESPQDSNIKSTIFQNKPHHDNNLITRDTYKPQNPKQGYRRSLTPHMGNFLLNQIGYIKKDNKFESKKNITDEKKKFRKYSSPNIRDFVSNMLVNGDAKNNIEEEDNKDSRKDDIKKSETISKMKFKGRRNSVRIKKKKKAFSITKSNLDKITENSNENNLDAEKALEIFNTINNGNFDLKQSAKMRYSLSFGDVDEEDNEESSNDDNNNDSSYISKIESKQVSMYDIDEDLKELKEIGNNLKSPVIRQARTNYKENKLISSFSINNNNDNVDENENNQTSILFQLKKMSVRNENENKVNKVNHNPIVFDDKLELSFHEDLNKKSSKASNSDSNLISYRNDINYITKLNYVNEKVISISMVENLKNNYFGFSYKNDTDVIKKINVGNMMDIAIIDSKRKKMDNTHNSHESLNNNNDSLINLVNENSNFTSNFNDISEKENDTKKITNNKNKKYIKKEEAFTYQNKSKNKNNQKYSKENNETIFIEDKKNKNNNFRKNNYLINNTNELNQLIKDKLNSLSKRNFNPINLITNRNREITKTSFEYTNTSYNNNNNNNYLFMSRENNISCLGTENSNNNITYNRYYNGNNITMNNYFNNNNSYRLNPLNNPNISCRNEKESDENDSVLSNSTKSYYNRNSNAIALVKNKLAMKLKEEIKKSKIFYKLENKDYNNLNENENQKYHRVSSLENIKVKNYLKRHYYMDDICNSDRGYYLMKTLSKCPSVMTHTNLRTKFEETESNNEYNGIAQQLSNILNISNMNYQINSSNKLNQIKEESIIYSNNKTKKDESKSMNNKNNKKSKSNIKIKNMCASEERHFISNNSNKNKSKDIDKKKSKKTIATKEFKLNNPINKNKNVIMRNHKNNLSIKNKTYVNKNNKNYSNNKNGSIQNKTFYYNSTKKRNKEFSINKENKTIINDTKVNKGISSYKNHEENKNVSRDKLDKSFMIKNKVGYYRNNRLEVENHSFLTNCHNSRTNINLKEYNDLLSRVEIKNNKSKSKINIQNKKKINKGELKKIYINKDKINNK